MTPIDHLPEYVCHKRVRAAKIEHISSMPSCPAMLWLEGAGRIEVPLAYLEKHKPHVGGYFVAYADGYQSFSPAAAFEEGYVSAALAGDMQKIRDSLKRPDTVDLPTTEHEAVAMLNLGLMWLKEHAPHRLKDGGKGE